MRYFFLHLPGPVKAVESYVSPEDTLILEDESGRAPLTGPNIPVSSLCTGQSTLIALKAIIQNANLAEVVMAVDHKG